MSITDPANTDPANTDPANTDPANTDPPDPPAAAPPNRAYVAFLAAVTATAVFGVLGVVYLTAVGVPNWGYTLFYLLPFAVGMAAVTAVSPGRGLILSVLVVAVVGLFSLVTFGVEGVLCCLLALPLVLPGLMIGAVVGAAFHSVYVRGRADGPAFPMLLLALLVLTADALERKLAPAVERPATVTSTVVVRAEPDHVWQSVLRFDALGGPESFLFRVGLPRPVRCTLDGNGIGARRACYFDQGVIEQTVTEWNPPSRLAVEVTRSTLPGRPWLRLASASYDITAAGSRTRVVRTTTFTSRLRPSFYWRAIEAAAVGAEHDFVLRNLRAKSEAVADAVTASVD